MRFLFYDRITEIEKGRRIVGVKAFALSEEFLRGHFSRRALVPGVILVEAMAQVLGWGVIHAHDFKLTAILSLVDGVRLHEPRLQPGFTARIEGEILSTGKRDSLGRAWVEADGRRLATLERIIFAHFPVPDPEPLRRLFRYYAGSDDLCGPVRGGHA
jgi:3-hydroxyacyl-[acyl-carrier-protein] dehydratase